MPSSVDNSMGATTPGSSLLLSFSGLLACSVFRQLSAAEKIARTGPLCPVDLRLGYETFGGPPFGDEDVLVVAIPRGFRCLLWSVAANIYLIETGKNGAFQSVWCATGSVGNECVLAGHLVQVTSVDSSVVSCFVADDVLREGGIDLPAANHTMHDKCGPLFRAVTAVRRASVFPTAVSTFSTDQSTLAALEPPYPVRCYQTRSVHSVRPRLNRTLDDVDYDDATNVVSSSAGLVPDRISDSVRRVFGPFEPDAGHLGATRTCSGRIPFVQRHPRLYKPTYRDGRRRVFLVQAHAMGDIYHLYCRGGSAATRGSIAPEDMQFHATALVPDAWTSAMMNVLFREPARNLDRAPDRRRPGQYPRVDLDRIEESDDEDDRPIAQLDRRLLMECEFEWTRKMWIPRALIAFDQAHRLVRADHL